MILCLKPGLGRVCYLLISVQEYQLLWHITCAGESLWLGLFPSWGHVLSTLSWPDLKWA